MKPLAATVIDRLHIGHAPVAMPPLASGRHGRHWVNLGWLLAVSLVVAVPLFYRSLFGMIIGDHDVHVRLAQRGIGEGVWPAHFLFQAIIYALSGFSRDFVPLAWASLALLTMCVVTKAWLAYALLIRNCPRLPTATFEDSYGFSHGTLLTVVAATLVLSAPIMQSANRIYLGQISPNIWHNPTTILCWPLVILLFFTADSFLRSGRLRELFAVGALAALSVVAKPNYFLAFAPVYGLLALRRFGFSRMLMLSQAALIPTVILLYWQLTASFDGPNAMRPGRHIAWMPLSAWSIHSHSILKSLLFSLAFPLSYLALFRRSLQNRELLMFAWGVMLSALVWTSCFAEVRNLDGTVDGDFNFSWGSALSIFVLFLVTAIDMIDNPSAMAPVGRIRDAARFKSLPWWLLGAHTVSGVVWVTRQVNGKGY